MIVVNGKPTDDMIVRKSLGLTRVRYGFLHFYAFLGDVGMDF